MLSIIVINIIVQQYSCNDYITFHVIIIGQHILVMIISKHNILTRVILKLHRINYLHFLL